MSFSFISICLFAVAALGGAFLAFRHFTAKKQPMPVVLLHGAFAASGLVCLLYQYLTHGLERFALAALGLFLVAALGGFFLFFTNLRKKALPTPVVLLHAGLAVTAFALLAVSLI
jgi:hypothetical protein